MIIPILIEKEDLRHFVRTAGLRCVVETKLIVISVSLYIHEDIFSYDGRESTEHLIKHSLLLSTKMNGKVRLNKVQIYLLRDNKNSSYHFDKKYMYPNM